MHPKRDGRCSVVGVATWETAWSRAAEVERLHSQAEVPLQLSWVVEVERLHSQTEVPLQLSRAAEEEMVRHQTEVPLQLRQVVEVERLCRQLSVWFYRDKLLSFTVRHSPFMIHCIASTVAQTTVCNPFTVRWGIWPNAPHWGGADSAPLFNPRGAGVSSRTRRAGEG